MTFISKIRRKEIVDFYEGFMYRDPRVLLFLIVITFGFYIIHWIYMTNKDFEMHFKDEAPNSMVGIFIMFILPFAWFFFFFMYNVLFPEINLVLEFIKKMGWIFIIFLILEYIYRFCLLYSEITITHEHIWFWFFFPGFLAIALMVFGQYYAFALIFFMLIVVPAMQAQLNSCHEKYFFDVVKTRFNSFVKASFDFKQD